MRPIAAIRTYRRNGPRFAYSDRLRALFDAYDSWQDAHQDLVGRRSAVIRQMEAPVEPGLTESRDGRRSPDGDSPFRQLRDPGREPLPVHSTEVALVP